MTAFPGPAMAEPELIGGIIPANGKGKIRLVSIFDLRESGLNDLIYRPPHNEDPTLIALADSIMENGVLEPLVVSKDGYIISGHRRKAACAMALLWNVPCVTVPITKDDPRFIKLLREFNRQRSKGFEEIIAEAMVDASGETEEIARNLMIERKSRAAIKVAPMEIEGHKSRAEIKGNRPLLDAAIKIIDELEDFWPLSDRQIHYGLLNNPPLRHAKKPCSTYLNDRASYQVLCNVLTRGRLSGEIPWEAIAGSDPIIY